MASYQDKKHRRKSVQSSDPGKILDLVMSLTDNKCAYLQVKINIYLMEQCDADLAFLIVVHGDRKEASIEAVGSTAMEKKVNIHMSQKFMDVMKNSVEQSEVFSKFGEDFQSLISQFLPKEGMPKKSVVMLPIADTPFSVIACLVAPKLTEEQVRNVIHECFLFIWPTLQKAIGLDYECTLKQKCQQLLRVARRLFTKVATLDTLLQMAMEQAKLLMKASHCSFLLVDVEKMQLIHTCYQEGATETVERRFPMDIGITGHVIKTGVLINAKVAKDHPKFDPEIDCKPGVQCKTLLCFPIRDQTGIIGVGQLMNKIGEPYFDAMDEEMALAFSIYCGVCIVHSVVYEKIQEAHIRNALANELVMYHMQVSDSEVERMLECKGFHNHPHIASVHFNPRALPLRELPCYVLKMFADLGFDVRFKIRNNKLAHFVLLVKKGYRDVPYHNWGHAFNVAQWAYAALVNFKLVPKGYLTDLQAMMYVVSGLVHDLDHRGTSNSFQIQGQTALAALYSSEGSVMERHHLAQAICILNTEGCNILEHLPRRDYDRALLMLRDYVLASDLANYFKNLNDYKTISIDFQQGNRVHTSCLMSMLMNAADLSDQLKDWGSVKKTAAAVLTEFFKQGDVEKSRGELPAVFMDREKCFIPDLEITFLSTVCLPLYEMLGRIIRKAAPCVTIIETIIERWDAAKPIFAEVPITSGLSVLLSPELDKLIEFNLKEKERLRESPDQEN